MYRLMIPDCRFLIVDWRRAVRRLVNLCNLRSNHARSSFSRRCFFLTLSPASNRDCDVYCHCEPPPFVIARSLPLLSLRGASPFCHCEEPRRSNLDERKSLSSSCRDCFVGGLLAMTIS